MITRTMTRAIFIATLSIGCSGQANTANEQGGDASVPTVDASANGDLGSDSGTPGADSGSPGEDSGSPGEDGGAPDSGTPSTAGLCQSDAQCDDQQRCTVTDPDVCLTPLGCGEPGMSCPDVCYGACVYRGALELAFEAGPTLNAASSYTNFFGVLLADFTNDGYADVLLTDHTGGDENHYWAGDGNGGFTLLPRDAHGVGQGESFPRGALWITLLDLDQDGLLDWYWDDVSPPSLRRNTGGGVFEELAASSWTSGRIRGFYLPPNAAMMNFVTSEGLVIRGDALLSGRISAITPSTAPGAHQDVIAQVDCDPIGYHGEPICATHLGATAAERSLFTNPSVVIADLNGDDIADLVVSYGESFSPLTEPRIYRGVGDGTYLHEETLPARLRGPYADYSNIIAADFDNDGLLDLALAGVSVPGESGVRTAIYRNLGGFNFEFAVGFSEGASDSGGKDFVAAGDYDNDGRIDIAVISGGGVQLHHNSSTPLDGE